MRDEISKIDAMLIKDKSGSIGVVQRTEPLL